MGRLFTKFTNQLSMLLATVMLLAATSANAQITVSATSTNISCGGSNNGSAIAIATDGWAPYTYLWSNGATTANINDLAPGTYTVTVTDIDLAFGTASVTITSAPAVGVTTFSSALICEIAPDGTATAVPFGGVPPYTYQWNNGGTTALITGLTAGTYTVTVSDQNNCTAVSSVNVLAFGEEGIWIGDMITNVICFGANNGTATAMPMSGTAPYTYLWSNGGTTMKITDLTPGNYTVTVTDINGCFGSLLFVITQPTDLTVTQNATAALCVNNGTATVTPSGGTPPYAIVWSNGQTSFTINNLAPGTYTSTVTDANGCTEGATVTVTGSGTGLTLQGTVQVPAGCNIGGSASVTITNNAGPFTYLWSNGQTTAVATNLPVGNSSVTVTAVSSGCTGTATINIPQATPIITTIVATTNATCAAGGTATVSASGGVEPYTYKWSNNQTTATATNLAAGTHTVTVTDATGCIKITTAVIGQSQGPTVTAQVTVNATCITGATATATATGGVGAYTYLWSNGQTTATATNLAAGTRTVTVTDANGCAASASVTVVVPDAPTATVAINSSVSCTTGGSATVTASGGVAPLTFKWSNNATTTAITNIPAGTYTVTVTAANGCTATATTVLTPAATPTVVITASSAANCSQPGSATASASGATGPYTYKWSNGELTTTAVNLTGGTYTVTATAANGCTATATVTIAQTNNGITVGDFVWYDNDQDGLQAPAELTAGVNGVTVMLLTAGPDGFFGTADDITQQTTTTNAAGFYQFTCVTPGTYVVMFSGIPTGYEFTQKDAAVNDCKDSDANANGKTVPFTVVAGQANIVCIDAGIHIICVNTTYPGSICCDQTICAGDVPALLFENAPPLGGVGALQYLWMEYIQVGPSPPQWYGIPGATSINYQPGPLTKTSYFMRCVRREGCANFIETNIVTITVIPQGGPGCGGFSGSIILSANGNNSSVGIKWATFTEIEDYTYTVQHSVNTTDWTDIATITGKKDLSGTNNYEAIDQTPASGMNFYRIQRNSATGSSLTSEMADIELSIYGADAISVYPNPFKSALYVKNIAKFDGDVLVSLTTTSGMLITSLVIPKGATEIKDLGVENLPAGMYFARIRFGNGDVKVVKVTKI
jgi:hypothetical protein